MHLLLISKISEEKFLLITELNPYQSSLPQKRFSATLRHVRLFAVAGEALPSGFRRRLSRYRYGPGAFKLDWALSEPVPWQSP